MPRNHSINYVEFPCSDFEVIEKFYTIAFGWTFTHYGAEYMAFSDGEFDGGFYKSSLISTSKNGGALVIMYAENLETTRQIVLDSGGRLSLDIFPFPGGRRFQFLDPHGNELSVWSDKPLQHA